jgi:hypothetical protein
MSGARHPRRNDFLWRAVPHGDILCGSDPRIPGLRDTLNKRRAIGAGMAVEIVGRHILAVAHCRRGQRQIAGQRRQAGLGTLSIGEFDHALGKSGC